MESSASQRLALHGQMRRVDRTPDGQIQIRWDRIILTLRKSDLLVLAGALRAWREALDPDWARDYSLLLNESAIFLSEADLHHFCALISEAAGQLSRRKVRWADLDVRIVPCQSLRRDQGGRLSAN